ncbi:hypothetical protein E4665_15910 [Sporolactobacillus shoreae]|uniref:RNase H type-1 domain-containing protein n=1 Tax=Sporolactobacillus shoreae TaxID=1465501 RepID=A0A4Z0GK73_9BACL|nr:hypothetical protein [Sporolactobacillus shoreae]TGA96348.1 hypothetical protein E4665_15910 [Sporolactobacillus shoreae]
MDKHIHHHYEPNRHTFLNEFAIPTQEAIQRSGDMQFDNETLRIFVDASELYGHGIFGLAGCFVGQGQVFTESKKIYNLKYKRQNAYAEYMVILYVIQRLPGIIRKKYVKPDRIFIFSDFIQFEKLIQTDQPFHDEEMNQVVAQIKISKQKFESLYPNIKLDIRIMSHSLKRNNPFYKAAHNAARKATH